MGMRQAAEKGRWLNRAPTGYDMVNGELVPNELAPLVVRVFELRAEGKSYLAIESEVGFKYSTVRHICENRVYLGKTRLRDKWDPGDHKALVTLEQFDAAENRGHVAGRRRSKDLLSGKVRCGLLGAGGVHRVQRAQRRALPVQAPREGLRAARPVRQWPSPGCCYRPAGGEGRPGPPGRRCGRS